MAGKKFHYRCLYHFRQKSHKSGYVQLFSSLSQSIETREPKQFVLGQVETLNRIWPVYFRQSPSLIFTCSLMSSTFGGSSLLCRLDKLKVVDVIGSFVAMVGFLKTVPGRGTTQSSESLRFVRPDVKSFAFGNKATQLSHILLSAGLNRVSSRLMTELRRQSRLMETETRGLLRALRLTR